MSQSKVTGYEARKRVLLVDLDDVRRRKRVRMLTAAGYEVETRVDHEMSEALEREASFDLLVLALHHKKLEEAAAYSERPRKKKTNSADPTRPG